MARYCGLSSKKGRESVGKWERGQSVPEARRRIKFIDYLCNSLGLCDDKKQLYSVWEMLEEEWDWDPLTSEELLAYHPNRSVQPEDRNLDPTTVHELFGPAAKLINLKDITPASPGEIRSYYEGATLLTWHIIAANADVERDQCESLVERLINAREGIQILCLSGEMGAGKSTLAWRLASQVAEKTKQPLLHIRGNKSDVFWDLLESGIQQYTGPLIILVDDVFRDENALTTLESLDPDLNITVIASSRSNEIPEHLRLPFPIHIEKLNKPSPTEKIRILQKLSINEQIFSAAQRRRLQEANSWLVVMVETTTAQSFVKIIRDGINHLKARDEAVYRAYEYIAFSGQYNLSVPESLLTNLNEQGLFYNLAFHPASRGYIFKDELVEGRVRAQHPAIAKAAFSIYHRDPAAVLGEFIDAVQVDILEHRIFIGNLFKQLLLDSQHTIIQVQLAKKATKIQSIMAASGTYEIVYFWSEIYRGLGDDQGLRLEQETLEKKPDTYLDWVAFIRLAERKMTSEQITQTLDQTVEWLRKNNNFDFKLGRLMIKHGTYEQVVTVIDYTFQWLQKDKEQDHVVKALFKLIQQKGIAELASRLIDYTLEWLKNHEHYEVHGVVWSVVEHWGSTTQFIGLLDHILQWLSEHPKKDSIPSQLYQMVLSHGTEEQSNKLLALTFQRSRDENLIVKDLETPEEIAALIGQPNNYNWLFSHPHNIELCAMYMALIEGYGTPEQINSFEEHLNTYPQNVQVHLYYLGLVERLNNIDRINRGIEATITWLKGNPGDSSLRRKLLTLADRYGTPDLKLKVINDAAVWLQTHPRKRSFTNYLLVVQKHGTLEQKATAINQLSGWLNYYTKKSDSRFARKIYLDLVMEYVKYEIPEQFVSIVKDTVEWLDANPKEREVRKKFHALLKASKFKWATIVRKNQNHIEARYLYGLASRIWPNDPFLCLGWAFLEKDWGDYEKARLLFQKATKFQDTEMNAWQAWAILEKELGNYARARELFHCGTLSLSPLGAHSWQAWGIMEKELGNYEIARQLFQKGTQLHENEPAIWTAWALLELEVRNVDSALSMAQKAVRLSSNNFHTYFARGQIYAVRGDIELAKADFTKSKKILDNQLRTKPNDARLLNLLGRTLIYLGRYTDAESVLRRSLEYSTDHSKYFVYNAIGELYEAQGDIDRAVDAWLESLRYNPHNLVAKKHLQRIRLNNGDYQSL